MDPYDIRSSLNYTVYIEHSQCLKIAADQNDELFIKAIQDRNSERQLQVGLLNSTMLLYSVSVELIFKARALYEEREDILSGKITDFNSFMNQWKKSRSHGHDYFQIIEHYKLALEPEEKKVFKELLSYTSWAGRFPFPMKEEEIEKLEKGFGSRGKFNKKYRSIIETFIQNQKDQMQNINS
ncbi:hypothetical protein [Aquimarina intermedia]|uniref:Uncharacterized protein n=1 Tax=Aquimarina intermedia TaxID=350814 RepID=A0A5S5C6U7_9FLAO|nr:hypothetical protein [Aquimarina intermedia]TYP74202.1 hypothetical protein BD809_10417 [Aquimarina intermedia]